MTLDEAIKHCEEIAMDKTNLAQTLWDSKEKARCKECADEHEQLAQWLIELKILRNNDVLDKIRTEFINRYPKNYAGELEFGGNICHFSLNDVLQIIDYVLRIKDKCRKGANE